MIRRLVSCAIACCLATPVVAEERDVAAPDAPLLAVSVGFPGYDNILTVGGDIAVRLRSPLVSVATLAAFENRGPPDFEIIANAFDGDPLPLVSPYAVIELRSLEAWRLPDRRAPVTADANGFYAVRDLLAESRRPRAFRPRLYSTTLVVRIDGKDETPVLSIGGGGVPAALWGVMPQ